ncbi:hypothetical protein BT93_A1048 [Corymbia citriodora subsp. variegata]|nr:hypothetical protein BT93_A1048 [Corymbia citriodora subsp. variegata]
MDFHRTKAEDHKAASLLEGEEDSSLHKTLSRQTSLGNSNRYYQYRSPGKIPFQWERQPGECKFDPPKWDPMSVPRIEPPPISASKSMPLPSRPKHRGGPKESSSSLLKMKVWRTIKNQVPRLGAMSRSKNQARGSEATSKCSF